MKRRSISLVLLQALFLCVAGAIAMKMCGAEKISSLLFMMTFPLTVLLWLWNMRKGVLPTDLIALGLAALAVFCVLTDLLLNKGSFSFSYIQKVIMFTMTLLFLQTMNKIRTDWHLTEFIQVVVDVLTVLMTFLFVLFHEQMYMINGIRSRYLTFGLGNPNTVAMFLAPMYMLTFCTLMKPSSKRKEVFFHWVMLALQLWFILATQSRNALMMVALFTLVALYVIFREKIGRKTGVRIPLRYPAWLSWLIALFPVIFAILYMALIGSDWIQNVFGFMVAEGKKLDSRVKEWTPAFEVIAKSPLIGSYYNISGGTGSSQMHSTHVDTAACYGVPVMLIMSYMHKICICQNGKEYKNKVDFLYMTGFCCSLLMGTFESAVYSGGLGVYVFALIFLALSRSRQQTPPADTLYGWEWVLVRGKQCLNACRERLQKKHNE